MRCLHTKFEESANANYALSRQSPAGLRITFDR